ncbi:hypothetical protein P691DRAFT_811934 [Macrolepiota fuliginosa MF-IS2]|uniref:Uncharacterized protein n=1 Tax=Macrolepiota fuliginosa MF-IS2 TaxID=1400762 RepID=A0A9P6C370_9AGAR|nr:hypothetical protein P691DRAFT_811934 [Macrolepiota fuliginosa MF-IS2]
MDDFHAFTETMKSPLKLRVEIECPFGERSWMSGLAIRAVERRRAAFKEKPSWSRVKELKIEDISIYGLMTRMGLDYDTLPILSHLVTWTEGFPLLEELEVCCGCESYLKRSFIRAIVEANPGLRSFVMSWESDTGEMYSKQVVRDGRIGIDFDED